MDDFDAHALPAHRASLGQAMPDGTRRLTVGSPADLLASVPVLLGFVPHDSVVMISLGPVRGPHARVDLLPSDARSVARALVEPASRHGVTQVALVVYADLNVAGTHAQALEDVFAEAGIEVAALVAADGSRWVSMASGLRTRRPQGYDPLSHRFVAQAVLAGQVILGSREELEAGLEPQPSLVETTDLEIEALAARQRNVGAPELRELARALAMGASTGVVPTPQEIAVLRHSFEDLHLRDHLWGWVRREEAADHVEVWRRVVRACRKDDAAGPASVLAVLAWLSGDGALAHCAVDRAEDGGGTSLSVLVRELLVRAVSPSDWEPVLDVSECEVAGAAAAESGATVVDLTTRRGRH